MNTTHSTKKKLLAQALGITAAAVLGVLANGGTAAADGHNVVDPEATWGAADGAEQRGVDIVPAVQSNDTSSTVPGYNTPVTSYPAGPSKLSGLVVPGGPVLAGERMGRCGRLTVATGVDGAKLDTGFYLRECLFPRLDSALKRRNVSQVEVDIRCCRGPFKAECAPRLCRRRRRRAPNPCVALPR